MKWTDIDWQACRRICWEVITAVYPRLGADRVSLVAAAIAFYTMLSTVPLLLLLVSASSYFLRLEQAQARIAELTAAFGPSIGQALNKEILSVVQLRGVLTGVALLVGVWSGSQIFAVLELAINQVWRTKRRRPFWISRGLAILVMIIVLLLILVAFVLTNLLRVFGELNLPLLGRPVDELPFVFKVLVSAVIPVLLATAIFTVLYRLLPTRVVTVRAVLPSAFIAGALWTISLHLFGWYSTHVVNFSVLYGSLGGVVLLMLWFYYSAWIMLLGAEIAVVVHQRLLAAGDEEERQSEQG